MAQTLTKLLVHVIFSTKGRASLIEPEIDEKLYAYMTGIGHNLGSPVLAINGAEDHVHLLVSLSKTITLADLVLNVKRDSSTWMNKERLIKGSFAWQNGYAAFTIGESQVPALKRYIAGQKEHHRKVSFQDELRTFLKKYGVAYDEKYVWS